MLIIDRIVDGFAICEAADKSTVHIELHKLPQNVKEGDCLIQCPDGSYTIDSDETSLRRKASSDLFKSLLE